MLRIDASPFGYVESTPRTFPRSPSNEAKFVGAHHDEAAGRSEIRQLVALANQSTAASNNDNGDSSPFTC
jgi:hypothetical protein